MLRCRRPRWPSRPPASKAEGNSGSTPFTFTVTRSGDTTGATTVDYTVTGSGGANAANAADFAGNALPPGGSLTFNAGETSKVITINVNGDTTVESDETFTVTLSTPVGGTITTAAATGTILNDDTTAVNQPPTLAPIADPAAIDANAGVQTVILTGISAGAGETQALSLVTATSDNTALIPNPKRY